MQRNEIDIDPILDKIVNKKKREFKFEETYVSGVYRVYTSHAALKNLYKVRSLLNPVQLAVMGAATVCQPLAKYVGYEKVEVVIGRVSLVSAFIVSPIPTLLSLGANVVAEHVLGKVWEQSDNWCNDNLITRELFACAYVAKSEGIAYCGKKIKDKLDKDKADKDKTDRDKAAKDKADKEKAQKDNGTNDNADRDKAKLDKIEKDKADLEKSPLDEAEKDRVEKERDKIAQEEKKKQEKNEQDTIIPKPESDNVSIWPEGFGWYVRNMSKFIILFNSGFNAYILDPDNRPYGEPLTLPQAIIYFLNGGCLLFSGDGKSKIFEQRNPSIPLTSRSNRNIYVPYNWRQLSLTEITSKWLKKIGITADTINNLINQTNGILCDWWQENPKANIVISKRVENNPEIYSGFVKRSIKDFFINLFMPTQLGMAPVSKQLPGNDILTPPATTQSPAEVILLPTVSPQPTAIPLPTPSAPVVTPAVTLFPAKTKITPPQVAQQKASFDDYVKNATNQNLIGNTKRLSVLTLVAPAQEIEQVIVAQVANQIVALNLIGVRERIANDDLILNEIKNARLVREKEIVGFQSKLAAAKMRMEQIKLHITQEANPSVVVVEPDHIQIKKIAEVASAPADPVKPDVSSIAKTNKNNGKFDRKRSRVKHAPTLFACAEREASISAEEMASSAFGQPRMH
jgi:hypothetical protein